MTDDQPPEHEINPPETTNDEKSAIPNQAGDD